MTNFGTLAILALDRKRHSKVLTPDEADLRLLLALETFPPDGSGQRSAGMKEVARQAGVPYGTARRARDRMVAAGLLACESGNGSGRGKGTYTRWRFLFPLKVPSQGEHLKEKLPSQGEHLNDDAIRCSPNPVKVLTEPRKGAHPNPLTSENPAPALGSSALGSSALSHGPAGDIIRNAVPNATDEEIDAFIAKISPDCRSGNIAGYLGSWSAADIAAK